MVVSSAAVNYPESVRIAYARFILFVIVRILYDFIFSAR